MIRKVEKLVSIGKFRNYQASGDVSFGKFTLIYAENGAGKTTLAAVLRSLTHGQAGIVEKRCSTNPSAPQSIHLIQRKDDGTDTHHNYGAAGWSCLFPGIEVFDVHFVNDNVYSGFEFGNEHRQRLHDFVVGAQGVAIKKDIEANKNAKAALRQELETIEKQIIDQVGCGLTSTAMTAFLRISEHDAQDIGQRLPGAQSALSNAKASAFIQNLPSPVAVSPISFAIDFDAIRTDFAATVDIIQDEALRRLFAAHCSELSHHGMESPESWIKSGIAFVDTTPTGDPCPFCQRSATSELDIIKAYRLHFSAALRELTERVARHLESLRALALSVHMERINGAARANAACMANWTNHLPATASLPLLGVAEEDISQGAVALIADVERKLEHPSSRVLPDRVTLFQELLTSANLAIRRYNDEVGTCNAAITRFRSGLPTEEAAQNALNHLTRTEKRWTPAVRGLCDQLQEKRSRLRNLEDAYTHLANQEMEAARAFFTDYKDGINHYLGDVFKTPFTIADVTHTSPRGKATHSKIDYRLTLDGQGITVDQTRPNSVRECLSEGDKSTIAFAFFLAKLDIDPNKPDKILVIDDPLSSFDANRRLYTGQIIRELATRMKQVIVLSHNEFFLYDLYKDVPAAERKSLRIAEDLQNHSSKIEPLDLEELVQADYFRHIRELQEFLVSPDLSKKERVLGLMRNVLEAHIRLKFHRQTQSVPTGQRTFGKLISELERQRVGFRQETTPPSIISKLKLINGVSWKPHHGDPAPDYRALGYDPNTMTTVELGNLIKDTFSLIDDEL